MNRMESMMYGLSAALMLTAFPAAVLARTNSDAWVANPESAVSAQWKPQVLAGRDFWMGLIPAWHTMDGVSQEKFVRDSALWGIRANILKLNGKALRTGIIREVELLDAKGRNQAPKVSFQFSSSESGVLFFHPENLNDRNPKTLAVLSSDHRDNKIRYKPVPGSLLIDGPDSLGVSSIRIYHGNRGCGGLCSFAVKDSSGKNVELVSSVNRNGVFTAKLKKPVPANRLRVEFATVPYRITIRDFSPAISEKLRQVPFIVRDIARMNENDLLGLRKENIDWKAFNNFTREYQNTFLGFGISEYDSNYGQVRRPGNRYFPLQGFAPRADRNRDDAVKYMRNLWFYQQELYGNNVFALSGGVMGSPYFCEWGAKNVILEYSCRLDRPARILMMMVKSAGKQYRRPWGFYMAYFADTGNPNSLSPGGARGLDYGQPPSHGFRAMLMNYYMGGNLQWFESQPWGQVKKTADGKHELTENGKAIKRFYEWITTPEGKRGSEYSPILLLLDYRHGQTGRPDWKVWYHLPMEDGDYMTRHIFNAISPLNPKARYTTPEHCINITNSPIGDVFDAYFANPPSGEVAVEELGKFPVTVLAGAIRFSPRLLANLKEYVQRGGTLVVNSGHLPAFEGENTFLGLKSANAFSQTDGMKVLEIQPLSAKVVLKAENGKPLVAVNRFGKGNVIFTTPYFMLMKNKTKRSPLIGRLLEKIQAEVLPVQVSGDVQFLLNKMDSGSWKLILMNNRGVTKEPLGSVETIYPRYDSKVTVSLPEGASAKELYASAPLERQGRAITLSVPAGGLRVLEIQNVKFGAPLIVPGDSQRKPVILPWQDLCPEKSAAKPATEKKIMAEWTFGEGQGNKVKDSVQGLEIKLFNQPEFVKHDQGYALKFDGKKTYGYGSMPLPQNLDGFTEEIWVKPDISSGSCWTMRKGKRSGFVVCHGTFSFAAGIEGGKWHQQTSYDGFCFDNTLPVKNGEWTHLVFTWKDFTAHYYVDGVEAVPYFGTFKLSDISKGKTLPIYLGTHYHHPGSGESRVFNGKISELRYFNYALSDKEIRARTAEGKKKYSKR